MFLTLSTPELLCEEPSADWLIYHTPPVISRGFYYMTLKKKKDLLHRTKLAYRVTSGTGRSFWRCWWANASHACDFLRPTAALVWLPVSTFHSSEVTAAMRADITASTCQVLAQPLREESICSLDAASWLTGVVPAGYVITAHIKLKKNRDCIYTWML